MPRRIGSTASGHAQAVEHYADAAIAHIHLLFRHHLKPNTWCCGTCWDDHPELRHGARPLRPRRTS